MCSSKIEKEINDLYALVSKLDPNGSTDHGYIEIVEASAPKTPAPKPAPPITLKPALPPPARAPNIMEMAFSFSGFTYRSYYFWNTLMMLALAGLVIGFVDAGGMAKGWGMLVLGIAAWSLLANTAKRWRDTGYNMWWLITLLMPYVSLVTIFCLLFLPSKRAP